MSAETIEEKTAGPSTMTDGVARASLEQLMQRWGAKAERDLAIDPKKPPMLVFVTSMSGREVWRRQGEWYELIEKGPVKP